MTPSVWVGIIHDEQTELCVFVNRYDAEAWMHERLVALVKRLLPVDEARAFCVPRRDIEAAIEAVLKASRGTHVFAALHEAEIMRPGCKPGFRGRVA